MSNSSVNIRQVTDVISMRNQISAALSELSDQASKFILLSCEEDYFPHDEDIASISLSERLSQTLLPLSKTKRESSVEDIIASLIDEALSNVVILKRIHVLFEPSLQLDPLKLLKELARQKPLIVFWPGVCNTVGISFSTPGRSDYQSYSTNDLANVPIIRLVEHGE